MPNPFYKENDKGVHGLFVELNPFDLQALIQDALEMYDEYIEVHGYDEEQARFAATEEVVEGAFTIIHEEESNE